MSWVPDRRRKLGDALLAVAAVLIPGPVRGRAAPRPGWRWLGMPFYVLP